MGAIAPYVPDWGIVGELQRQLAVVERTRPGSDRARDLEDAITLLLDGRTSSTAPRHRPHDAVRRARFLRRQAARKRPAALARLALPRAHPLVPIEDGEPAGEGLAEQAYSITPEDVICARETVAELSRPDARATSAYAGAVLAGLLRDRAPGTIAADLGISRSTVDRCIAQLRLDVRGLVANGAAA
ncbi:MAG: hypothetical protein ACYCU7_09170 [Acidimicrobiales bacterium]